MPDHFFTDARVMHGDSGGAVVSVETSELLGVVSTMTEEWGRKEERHALDTMAASLEGCMGVIEQGERIANGGKTGKGRVTAGP
jgi:hypothetical protein